MAQAPTGPRGSAPDEEKAFLPLRVRVRACAFVRVRVCVCVYVATKF